MNIQIGRFNIPYYLLALSISLVFSLLVLIIKKYGKTYKDFIFNIFIIAFLSWKLSPIITNFNGFLDNPIATLYLPGGVLGYVLSGVFSVIYTFYKIRKEKLKKAKLPLVLFYSITILFAAVIPVLNSPKGIEIKFAKYPIEDIKGSNQIIPDSEYIVLNFWATWCPPCKAELPELNSFYINNPGVMFYGINLIRSEESKDYVKNFIEEENIKFPVYFDGVKSLSDELEIKTIPTTIVLSKEGNNYSIKRHSGAITEDILEKMVE